MRRHKGNTAAGCPLLVRKARCSREDTPETWSAGFPRYSPINAAHNLKLAQIADWNFCSLSSVSCFESSEIKKRRCAMLFAFEVNFALWIMIGCATAKAVQFVG
jgi:hypothetical protein